MCGVMPLLRIGEYMRVPFGISGACSEGTHRTTIIMLRLPTSVSICHVWCRRGDAQHPADPTWTPLLATPAHPEYPSTHTVTAAASGQVLAR